MHGYEAHYEKRLIISIKGKLHKFLNYYFHYYYSDQKLLQSQLFSGLKSRQRPVK